MTNTVEQKINQENVSIIISAEHANHLHKIEECFPSISIDPCYIRKCRGELPMKIIIFLGGSIVSGVVWDIIKLGIQKVYDKFSKKELDFSIKFENMFFSVDKDGRVKAITLDHEQFSHIKTLDDLYVYIQEKTQSKMPNVDWKATTLGEITQMNLESISTNFGYDKILYLDTGSITENKIEQLQTVEIKDAPSRAKRLVKEGDIIYSTVRPNQKHFGFIKNPPKNLVVSTGFTVISPEKDIDGKFAYYYITQNYITEKLHQIAEQAVSAYPSIKPENIKQLPINLPPLPEQQAIAAVLSSFDDKIELLRAENQTLEQMGQELFKERFGSPLAPGRGNGDSLFTSGSKEKSPLGDLGASLPEGWRVGKLGEIAEITSGKRPSEISDTRNSLFEIPLIGATKIMGYVQNFLFDAETLVIGRVGTHGEVQMFYEKIYPSDNTLVIKSDNFYFTYFILKSIDYEKMNRGAVQPLITQSDLKSYEVIIPDQETLSQFDLVIKPIFRKIRANSEQIQTLSATRDQLLPKLMSGEVRVKF